MSISLEFDCDDDAEQQAIKQQYIEILRPGPSKGNYGAVGATTDSEVILENLPPLRVLNATLDTVRMNGLARVLIHSGKHLVKLMGPCPGNLPEDYQDYLRLLEAIRKLPNLEYFHWQTSIYYTILDLDNTNMRQHDRNRTIVDFSVDFSVDAIVRAILESGAVLKTLVLFSCPMASLLQHLLVRCKTTLEDLVLKRLGSHRVVKVLSKFLSREDCHLHAVDIT